MKPEVHHGRIGYTALSVAVHTDGCGFLVDLRYGKRRTTIHNDGPGPRRPRKLRLRAGVSGGSLSHTARCQLEASLSPARKRRESGLV